MDVVLFLDAPSAEVATSGVYSADFLAAFACFGKGDRSRGYEAAVEGNPLSIQTWLQYINWLAAQEFESFGYVLCLFLRALHYNPGSYKLWQRALKHIERFLEDHKLAEPELDFLEAVYKRGITHMHKFLKIRLLYPRFLWRVRRKITATRRAYDDILRTLPITQHARVWPAYIEFVDESRCVLTGMAVYSRCIQLLPQYIPQYIQFLIENEKWDQAVHQLVHYCHQSLSPPEAAEEAVDDNEEGSRAEREPSVLETLTGPRADVDRWVLLCKLLCEHPHVMSLSEGERLIRLGLAKSGSGSSIWCALAGYYSALGHFDLCMAAYDQGLNTVTTLEDFTAIYQSMTIYLSAKIEQQMKQAGDAASLSYMMDKLQVLLTSKGNLISRMRIRNAPHDVYEWLNRVYYFCNNQDDGVVLNGTYDVAKIRDKASVIEVFEEGIQAINPLRAQGPYAGFWIEYAKFFECQDQLEDARRILERGCRAPHGQIETLVALWCERAELELRHQNYQEALVVARRAVDPPTRRQPSSAVKMVDHDDDATNEPDPLWARLQSKRPSMVQTEARRSIRLWALLFDLELCFGTDSSTDACADAMISNKTATLPQVIEYGEHLCRKARYEDAFQLYEKALMLFNSLDLRIIYFSKFCSRYGARKVERTRDMFEKALTSAPEVRPADGKPSDAFRLYFMYAKFEIDFGLIPYAINILTRALTCVPLEDKFSVYQILISWTAKYYGVLNTRSIFEEGLQAVDDKHVVMLGLRFAAMETALLEIERARAIFEHVSQFTEGPQDPFWQVWEDFEVAHGNEASFANMKRCLITVRNARTVFFSEPHDA